MKEIESYVLYGKILGAIYVGATASGMDQAACVAMLIGYMGSHARSAKQVMEDTVQKLMTDPPKEEH